MPLIIPVNRNSSNNNSSSNNNAALGPLSQIYVEYEKSKKSQKVKKRSRSTERKGDGGDGGKKKRLEGVSARTIALKDRLIGSNNVNLSQKQCSGNEKAQKKVAGGVCQTQNDVQSTTTTPCNYINGCTDKSVKDGLCKTHWCATNLCTQDGCIKLIWANGLCREHRYPKSSDDAGVGVSKVVSVEEVDAEIGMEDVPNDVGNSSSRDEDTNEVFNGGPALCVEIPPPSFGASSNLSKSSSISPDVSHVLKEARVVAVRSVSDSSAESISIDTAATILAATSNTKAHTTSLDSPTETDSSSSSTSSDECTCGVVKGVRCKKHKKRRKPCKVRNCANQAVVGGICIKHGAKVKRCSRDGCENVVQKRGLCRKHGAYRGETCSFDSCTNDEVEGGLCLQHGARQKQSEKRTKCSNLSCTSAAVNGEMCLRHRALSVKDPSPSSANPGNRGCTVTKSGRKVKTCTTAGCTNRAIQGGQCFRHGAKAHRKLCSSEGCQNYVVRAGVCIKHGAKQAAKKNSVEETKPEDPVQDLIQEEGNSTSAEEIEIEKDENFDLFKSIDRLEGSCVDILLLLKNDH